MTIQFTTAKIPYLISAGEPSGDLLAGALAAELRKVFPQGEPFGIVGPRMQEAGVSEVFHIRDLTVMGFVEVIKHLPRIKRLENELLQQVAVRRPAFAVLVDYPGFHLHLAERLKKMGIKVFMYVAPQLWAWGEQRVARLKHVSDVVLGIMPFEQQFFVNYGVNYHYVGTPQVDRAAGVTGSRALFGLPAGRPLIGFFPGSRPGEIQRIVPVLMKIHALLRQQIPAAHFVLSIAPNLSPQLFAQVMPPHLTMGGNFADSIANARPYHNNEQQLSIIQGRSLDLMALCDAAAVTSGTATLECALVETPLCVVYVASALTYAIGRRLVKLPYISLVNLVAGRALVTEYVQNFDEQQLAAELGALASPSTERAELINSLHALHNVVKGKPEVAAAAIIVKECRT